MLPPRQNDSKSNQKDDQVERVEASGAQDVDEEEDTTYFGDLVPCVHLTSATTLCTDIAFLQLW